MEEKRQQREEERAKEWQLDESLVRSSKIALQLEKEQAEVRGWPRSTLFRSNARSRLSKFPPSKRIASFLFTFRQEKRRINEEIEAFRRLHQRREDRRDYDLYDPGALRTSLPCRVGDDDPRLGLASAQKYPRNYFERYYPAR